MYSNSNQQNLFRRLRFQKMQNWHNIDIENRKTCSIATDVDVDTDTNVAAAVDSNKLS